MPTERKILREIYASLPAIDGRLEEMTQPERDAYVKKVYKNTRKILSYGVLVPIKKGHDDSEEALRGHLISVYLKKESEPTPHYAIVGEMIVDGELYNLYTKDKLPAASVEIAERANLSGYTREGEVIDDHIEGVALLGSTPAAMPQLARLDYEDQPYALYCKRVYKREYNYKEFGSMEPKGKVMQLLQALASAIEELLGGGGEAPMEDEGTVAEGSEMKCTEKKYEEDTEEATEEAVTKEVSKDFETLNLEKDKRIEELEYKIKELESERIDREFGQLASEGRITTEERAQFNKIVSHLGLKEARNVYSVQRISTTPVIPAMSKEGINKNSNEYRRLKDLNFTEEDIKKHFEIHHDALVKGGIE
jgi:hypothetical protein